MNPDLWIDSLLTDYGPQPNWTVTSTNPSLDEQPKEVAIAPVAYGENLTVATFLDKLLWLPGGLVCVCVVWGWGAMLLANVEVPVSLPM